jgi:hypothetical protein
MRSKELVGLVATLAIGAAGCSPYVMSYTHLTFNAEDGLEVLERSSTSPDTQGNNLHSPKVGLPLKLRLVRPAFTLVFDTPLETSPVVLLSARDPQGRTLRISGTNVRRVYPGSAAELDGFDFSFYVQDAKGEPLSISIADASGKQLGAEVLPYKIVSRGYSFGFDGV